MGKGPQCQVPRCSTSDSSGSIRKARMEFASPSSSNSTGAGATTMTAGTLSGKDRAATELASFYKDVLPSDLAGARRLTHLRLAQLARESNLKFLRASFEPVAERNRTLTRLKIEMVLSGT